MNFAKPSGKKVGILSCAVILFLCMGMKVSAIKYSSVLELYKGQTVTFTKTAKYSSLNKKIAVVSKDGKRLVGKGIGSTVVVAKFKNQKFYSKVNVVKTKKTYRTEVGKSITISAKGWKYEICNDSTKASMTKQGSKIKIKGKKESCILLKATKGKKKVYYKLDIGRKGSLNTNNKDTSGNNDAASDQDSSQSQTDDTQRNEVDVPSVIGEEEDVAEAVFADLGLVIVRKAVYSSDYEMGRIVNQSIAPNSSAYQGDMIVLYVSKGEKPDADEDDETKEKELTKVTLNKTSISSTKTGEKVQLSVSSYTPSDATDTTISWSSTSTSVATVSDDGLVTTKGAGSATIQAVNSSGTVVGTCSVKVIISTVITKVTLNKTSLSLTKGETVTLSVTAYTPSNATDKTITWKSTSSTVATVSSSGLVMAKAAGSATIQALNSSGTVVGTCSVKVTESTEITKVTLNKTSLSLTKGETATLSVTAYTPSNATDKTITWKSTSSTVATVSSNGLVTAKAAGSATIQALNSSGTVVGTCSVKVTITAVITKVTLDKTSLSLTKGETATLSVSSYSYTPGNATDMTITWKSTSSTVATVSSSGVVTAKAAGSATIQVLNSSGTVVGTCSVTVPAVATDNAVLGVSLNFSELTIAVLNSSRKLTATVTPANASDSTIIWRSSDSAVATVTSGLVKAVGKGECTITASTSNGKSASCKIYSVLLGDVNSDGVVDAKDSFVLLSYLNKTTTLSTLQLKAADANQDGVVNDSDLDAVKALRG